MTREQYEDLFWGVSDEKWNKIVKEGLLPDRTSPEARATFKKLMKRKPLKEEMTFSDEETLFLGKMDLVTFGEKFPGEAAWYMELTE